MFSVPKVKESVSFDVKDNRVSVAIEQFPAMDCFKNPAGWTRNDLACLVAATSKAEYDMLVQRLQINDPQFNVKDDVAVADAINAIKPRWCQSPNEIVSYVDALTRKGLDDAYNKALEDVNINTENQTVDPPMGSDHTE